MAITCYNDCGFHVAARKVSTSMAGTNQVSRKKRSKNDSCLEPRLGFRVWGTPDKNKTTRTLQLGGVG